MDIIFFLDQQIGIKLSYLPYNISLTGNSKVKQRKSVATETASATFHDTLSANQNIKENQDEGSILLVPFVLHLAFMTFTAFFVMHVQVSTCFSSLIKACMEALLIHCLHTNFCLMKVSTRFLSASPPIYWAAAHILASPNCSKRWGYLICVYFIAYILLGSLLFSNFYPFTQEPWHSWLQYPTVNCTTMDLQCSSVYCFGCINSTSWS